MEFIKNKLKSRSQETSNNKNQGKTNTIYNEVIENTNSYKEEQKDHLF
jgi:hypothetical protein